MTLFRHYNRNTAFKKRDKGARVAFENFGPRAARDAWPQARIDLMCDLIADGMTFKDVAERLGLSKNAVVGRFARIRNSFGWQGA